MNTKTKTNKKNIKNINITMNKLTEEEIILRRIKGAERSRLYRERHSYADIKQKYNPEYIERQKIRIKKRDEKRKYFVIFNKNMPHFIEE